MGNHTTHYVAEYLMLIDNQNRVLMHQRKNSGYYDGYWSLVAGHLDGGETITQAMVREAKEEAGVTITAADLEPAVTVHRFSADRGSYVDVFFICRTWQGEITNTEPDKCSGIEFFPLDNLPADIVPEVQAVLTKYSEGTLPRYMELGWDQSKAA